MLPHIVCLVDACRKLGLKYSFVDQNQNYLILETLSGQKLSFLNTVSPFNQEVVARICRDKSFTYKTLLGCINMPKTEDFLDPFIDSEFLHYSRAKSYQEIAQIIDQNFDKPVVTKPNFQAQGLNVAIAQNYDQILQSAQAIFNKDARGYDFLMLAQEYIHTYQEFRVIVFEQKVVLVYLKDTTQAVNIGNLSPLHWTNAKAVHIQDLKLHQEIELFIAPIFEKLDLVYGGLDLILDPKGIWWLIEINTHPGFKKFLENNPSQTLTDMYQQILVTLR